MVFHIFGFSPEIWGKLRDGGVCLIPAMICPEANPEAEDELEMRWERGVRKSGVPLAGLAVREELLPPPHQPAPWVMRCALAIGPVDVIVRGRIRKFRHCQST